ncbi:permease prefix domain 1-containing protein [Kribbella sp. NPDC055071]
MPTRVSTRTPVDEYLAAMSRSLGGPRRPKADLLAEARDHLTDAIEAFEADGLDREAAERAAIADFGDLADVVPGYRTELAISQSRRTAVLLFMVLMIQPIVWQDGIWSWNRDVDPSNSLNTILNTLVEIVGMTAAAGAVLVLIATSTGMRYPAVRERVGRATAHLGLASAVVISVIGVAMAATSERPGEMLAGYGVVTAFVVLPLLLVGLQSVRGLRLARA